MKLSTSTRRRRSRRPIRGILKKKEKRMNKIYKYQIVSFDFNHGFSEEDTLYDTVEEAQAVLKGDGEVNHVSCQFILVVIQRKENNE